MLTRFLYQGGIFGDDDSLAPPTSNSDNVVVNDGEKKAEAPHQEEAVGYLPEGCC